MLDPDDVNVRAATFGRIVEDFLSSPVGSFLYEKAQRDRDRALNELKTVDAAKCDDVRAIQLKVRVADCILTWLSEAILNGRSALDQLKEEDHFG